MADGGPDSSEPVPRTAQSDSPTHQELVGPVMAAGGGAPTSLVGAAAFYGFWIVVSIATGRDMPTLRWSIPFMLVSLAVCVLSAVVGMRLDRLAGNAASLASAVLVLLTLVGGACTLVGFIITVVAFVDVGVMAEILYGV